jgi:hypothetical protein
MGGGRFQLHDHECLRISSPMSSLFTFSQSPLVKNPREGLHTWLLLILLIAQCSTNSCSTAHGVHYVLCFFLRKVHRDVPATLNKASLLPHASEDHFHEALRPFSRVELRCSAIGALEICKASLPATTIKSY